LGGLMDIAAHCKPIVATKEGEHHEKSYCFRVRDAGRRYGRSRGAEGFKHAVGALEFGGAETAAYKFEELSAPMRFCWPPTYEGFAAAWPNAWDRGVW